MPTMYTLTVSAVTKDSPGAGKLTVVFDYTSATVSTVPTVQVTLPNYTDQNPNWSRINRVNEDNFMVMRNGVQGVAVGMPGLNQMAYAISQSLTFAPVVIDQPEDDSCVASSTAATFTTDFGSELAATYQWQYETKSTGTVTTDNTELADGDTVTVDGQAYRFKDTPAQPYDVKRHGTTADTTLANLIAAINATGTPGTEYFVGTPVHPTVQADAAVAAHVVTLRARLSGADGDLITLAKSAAHLSVGGAVFSGGGTWNSASGTVLGCAYTNGTTETLTCTPTTKAQSGTQHRCVATNAIGSITSSEATLTIT